MTKPYIPLGLLSGGLLLSLWSHGQTAKESPFITQLRQDLSTKMKISGARADSVIDAEVIYIKELRKMQKDSTLTADQKKIQSTSIQSKRNTRIESALHLNNRKMKALLAILPDTVPKPAHTKID